jgi:hypothetical protein
MDAYVGSWQRVCTGSSLSGSTSTVLADSRSFVSVESTGGLTTWSFGTSLTLLRTGYSTSLAARDSGTAFTPLIVTFSSGSGWGALRADGVLSLTLLSATGALATVTYRVLDADTLAVSITEVPEKGDAEVKQGYLFRVFASQPVLPE